MQGVYCPGDVHWARLEASALGSLCLPRMEEKRREEKHIDKRMKVFKKSDSQGHKLNHNTNPKHKQTILNDSPNVNPSHTLTIQNRQKKQKATTHISLRRV